jgi:hypothetical protein
VTTAAYNIVKKALQKKRAEVTATPAAAKKFLLESGLWDVLEDEPIATKRQKPTATASRTSGIKKSA